MGIALLSGMTRRETMGDKTHAFFNDKTYSDFVVSHLCEWLDHSVFEDERSDAYYIIMDYISEEPDVLDSHDWSTILRMARA